MSVLARILEQKQADIARINAGARAETMQMGDRCTVTAGRPCVSCASRTGHARGQ